LASYFSSTSVRSINRFPNSSEEIDKAFPSMCFSKEPAPVSKKPEMVNKNKQRTRCSMFSLRMLKLRLKITSDNQLLGSLVHRPGILRPSAITDVPKGKPKGRLSSSFIIPFNIMCAKRFGGLNPLRITFSGGSKTRIP
jgi:hypothetical protein